MNGLRRTTARMVHSLLRVPRGTDNAESGAILLETIVAVPLLVVLLATLGTMIVFGARAYLHIIADAELQQELQIAFQRVTDDLLEAKEINFPGDRDSAVTIIKRQDPLRSGYEGESTGVNYWLNNVEGTKKLVKESASAPMTGNHALAGITITEFSCRPDQREMGVYTLRLTGRSGVTGHEYGLSTAIYVPRP